MFAVVRVVENSERKRDFEQRGGLLAGRERGAEFVERVLPQFHSAARLRFWNPVRGGRECFRRSREFIRAPAPDFRAGECCRRFARRTCAVEVRREFRERAEHRADDASAECPQRLGETLQIGLAEDRVQRLAQEFRFAFVHGHRPVGREAEFAREGLRDLCEECVHRRDGEAVHVSREICEQALAILRRQWCAELFREVVAPLI